MNNADDDELNLLARRVGRTYHAHLSMAKRLQKAHRYWNAALICLSALSSIAAVGLLAKPDLYDGKGGVIWAIIGIVTLVASLVLANADYKRRSDSAFRDYRNLQQLWISADRQARTTRLALLRRRAVASIQAQYQALLDSMPNHSEGDYLAAMQIHGSRSKQFVAKDPTHVKLTGSTRLRAILLRLIRGLGEAMPLLIVIFGLLLLLPLLQWMLFD